MIDKIFYKLEDIIEAVVPEDAPDTSLDCDKTILCAAHEHKRDCHARTVSIEWYANRIKGAV